MAKQDKHIYEQKEEAAGVDWALSDSSLLWRA
jgi:hypothetical protein